MCDDIGLSIMLEEEEDDDDAVYICKYEKREKKITKREINQKNMKRNKSKKTRNSVSLKGPIIQLKKYKKNIKKI